MFVIQLLGIVYTIVGLALLLNTKYYKKMIDDYARSLPTIFFNAFITLLISYWLISIGSFEKGNLPILVSVIGWLGLVKAVFMLVVPQSYTGFVKKMNIHIIHFEAWLAFILGLVLVYFGFLR